LSRQHLKSFKTFPNGLLFQLHYVMTSFLNFAILLFEKYCLNQTLTSPSHLEIEFVERLCICFPPKGMKCISWVNLQIASSNKLPQLHLEIGKHQHFLRISEACWGLNANCTSSRSSGTLNQDGLAELRE